MALARGCFQSGPISVGDLAVGVANEPSLLEQPDGAHDEHWKQACREIEAKEGATMLDPTPTADMPPAAAAYSMGKTED